MTYLLLYPLPSITLATLLFTRQENEVAAFRRWLEGVDVGEFERSTG